MSNSNGTSYTARSMNGIITIDDGAGTTIENGTITTDNLALNTITAEHLNQECNIWESNSGTTNYSTLASGPVNFATSTTSDINIGPSVNMISYGNLNIGTSDGLYGDIAIGSLGASGRLIFQTRITEVLSEPTTDNGIVNKIYADGNISSLLSSTNIWTGSNNTFNNSLSTHLIVADDNTNNCYFWEHNSGVSNYSTSSSGTVNFATHSSGNINIGPVSGVSSTGDLHIGTSTALSGHIVIGSSSATNSMIKFQTPITEVLSQPTTANGVVNKLYADGKITSLLAGTNIWTGPSNTFNNITEVSSQPTTNYGVVNKLYADGKITTLLAGTNIWTGPSNTFNNPIYASLITPLASGNNLSIGGSLSPNTFIQNSNGLIIGKNPSTYSTSTGYMTGEGVRFTNDTNTSLIDFHSTTSAGQQDYTGRIIVQNGTGVNTGTMTISAGTITLTPTGDLTLGTDTNTNKIGKLTINSNNFDTSVVLGDLNIGISNAGKLTLGTDTNTNKIGKLTIDSNNFDTSVVLGDLNIGISNAGKLNIGGQSPTVFGGKTQIKGSVIDLFSAGTLTIGSANTTSLIMGSSTSAVAIKSSGTIILGKTQDPITSYGVAGPCLEVVNITGGCYLDLHGNGNVNDYDGRIQCTGGTTTAGQGVMTIEAGTVNLTATGGYTNINGINNASCQFIGGGGAMYLDFHSYNGTPTAFDGRIRCDGADGTTQGGTMQYLAKQHDFDGLVNFWNGMRFQKGNLTSAFYIQNGTTTMNTVLGAGNAMTPVYQAFPTQWGGATAPKVQLTLWTTNVPAAMGIIVSFYGVSTSGFYICMYNARSTNAASGAYGVHWTATGSW